MQMRTAAETCRRPVATPAKQGQLSVGATVLDITQRKDDNPEFGDAGHTGGRALVYGVPGNSISAEVTPIFASPPAPLSAAQAARVERQQLVQDVLQGK
ncbi:hypothetical protein EON67_01390, partial [archaeon]